MRETLLQRIAEANANAKETLAKLDKAMEDRNAERSAHATKDCAAKAAGFVSWEAMQEMRLQGAAGDK